MGLSLSLSVSVCVSVCPSLSRSLHRRLWISFESWTKEAERLWPTRISTSGAGRADRVTATFSPHYFVSFIPLFPNRVHDIIGRWWLIKLLPPRFRVPHSANQFENGPAPPKRLMIHHRVFAALGNLNEEEIMPTVKQKDRHRGKRLLRRCGRCRSRADASSPRTNTATCQN